MRRILFVISFILTGCSTQSVTNTTVHGNLDMTQSGGNWDLSIPINLAEKMGISNGQAADPNVLESLKNQRYEDRDASLQQIARCQQNIANCTLRPR